MSIIDNLKQLRKDIPLNVRLVAVSKFKLETDIWEAYNAGQLVFGESRVQELVQKYTNLPKNIEWHLIGHLQTNKVKQIVPFISLIHSVDSLNLLETINTEAAKCSRIVDCLLEMHIATEEAKFGFSVNEGHDLFHSSSFHLMRNVRIVGVMGIATYTEDEQQVRQEFVNLKAIFDLFKEKYFQENEYFKEISMGMSGDYSIAIQSGSTIVRIGTSIFGGR